MRALALPLGITLFLLGALFLPLQSLSAEESIEVDLGAVTIAGPAARLVEIEPVSEKQGGEEVEGVRLTFQKHTSAYGVHLSVGGVDLQTCNTLIFNARFKSPKAEATPPNFRLMLLDGRKAWVSTSFLSRAKKNEDGSYSFSWDVVNDPHVDLGANYSDIQSMRLNYSPGELAEGETESLTITNMKFVSGRSVRKGDPELFKKWTESIQGYEPDYSDSSRYLLPPETGRIAKPLALAEGGQPLAEIVLPGEATIVEENAAKELQRWIREISGAELPLVDAPSEDAKVKIHLGRSFAGSDYAADIAALGETDGYAVRTKGESVYIFGSNAKGTMNGVFAFIENNSDLIWARPHWDYGTVFSKDPNMKVVWGDVCERPVGGVRGYFWNTGAGEHHLWSNRNRSNYNGNTPWRSGQWGDRLEIGGGHNLQTFIPKDDPLYYPIVKGVRPEKLSIWQHQICLSVPNLVETYSRNVLEFINTKAQPGTTVVNIKIEDNKGVCECEPCTAPITLPNGETLTKDSSAFRSTQYYDFLNKVTAKVVEAHPHLSVQTYAYFFTAIPPKIALHPKLYLLFCPYVRKDYRTPLYSPINDGWWHRLKGFAELTPNIVIREYFGLTNWGRPVAEVVAEDFRTYAAMGVVNIGSEVTPDYKGYHSDGKIRGAAEVFDVDMMEAWLLSRIYWDPNADVEQLRKYFLRRTFREAAPMMERFFGTFRQSWYSSLRPPSSWGNFRSMVQNAVVSAGKEEEMGAYLAEAASVATHPASRVLISLVSDRYFAMLDSIKNPPDKVAKPAAEKPGKTPELALKYAWQGSKGCEIYRTTIELGGKFVPALHVKIKPPINPREHFRCPFEFDATDFRYRYLVVPKSPETRLTPLPSLYLLTRMAGGRLISPPEAYQSSPAAPGAYQFDWKPEETEATGKQFNPAEVYRLTMVFDKAQLAEIPEDGLEFYIVEMSAGKVAGE